LSNGRAVFELDSVDDGGDFQNVNDDIADSSLLPFLPPHPFLDVGIVFTIIVGAAWLVLGDEDTHNDILW
jgi:hypothetical protein